MWISLKLLEEDITVLKVVKKDRKFNKKDKNKESTDSDQKTRKT